MFHFAPQQRSVVLSLKDANLSELSPDDRLEALHVGPLIIPFINFQDTIKKIENGFIWTYEPDLIKWSERKNQIISLKQGKELFLSEVRYDSAANKIYPPN